MLRERKISRRECNVACWSEPFRTMLNGQLKVTIGSFLDQLDTIFDPELDWIFRSRNFQAFELGIDYMNDSPQYIDDQIKGDYTDKYFKLMHCKLL